MKDDEILKEIIKEETAYEKFLRIEKIYIGIVLGLCLFFIVRGIHLRNDDSITVYKCPDSYLQDFTIKLKKTSDFNQSDLEDEIRSFMRKYIMALYPKNKNEAVVFFDFIVRHTSNDKIKSEYRAYQEDIEGIADNLEKGQITEFFPKNSSQYQISKVGSELKWIFQIEGYLNNRQSLLKDDRGVVTLRFEIVAKEATSKGSYNGLYVEEYEILHMEDVISKDIKNVKSN